MHDDLMHKWELSRRRVLAGAAGLGLAGASGAAFGQGAGPWATPPKSKVDRVNSAVWVWNYNAELLEKAKIDKPFASYEEFIEHCVKAKKDGVARYPIMWVAGVGLEQLPGTWYQMTWNKGGMFFDKQGNHMLGAGSVARETLKWWANTFEKGLDIADPESLKVQ